MMHSGNIQLVLASQSPRRVELLRNLGLEFQVIPSHIEELTTLSDPGPAVEDLALQKARAVAQQLPKGESAQRTIVLGADTVVVLGKDILGKPSSREDAYQMLVRMSGRAHRVFTGVALVDADSGKYVCAHENSHVFFRPLDSSEIRAYARTEEPMDKAGAYALQGTASAFVEKVDGCYSNIIGLPVPLTVRLLRDWGVRILGMP